ncbi:MAG: hypothetical protein V1792_06565 [Pseudomonadota bacterium]
MEDKDLTPKQRKWLEASRKIGPGAMTKTERKTLDRLYADMLPAEQQELLQYIQEKFGKKKEGQEDEPTVEEPTHLMERRVWTPPSEGLKKALAGALAKSPVPSPVPSGSPRPGVPKDLPSSEGENELIRKLRVRAEELLSQGVLLDLERVEAGIAVVESLQKDVENLRMLGGDTDRETRTQEMREKEKELTRAERELKNLIEPVSDLLDS